MMVLYTNYSTRWIDINHVLSRVSSMHRSDYCINYVLVLALFTIIFLIEALQFLSLFCFVARNATLYTLSKPNFNQRTKCMSQPLCFTIEY